MHTLRLLAVSLATLSVVAAGSAQSAPQSTAAPAQPTFENGSPAPPQATAPTPAPLNQIVVIPSRSFTFPGMGCDPLACVDGQHALTAPKTNRQFAPLPTPNLAQTTPGFFHPSEKDLNAAKLLAQNTPRSDATCYTLRSYQFTPTTPGSGAGKITGESMCQPSNTIHQKAVLVEATDKGNSVPSARSPRR